MAKPNNPATRVLIPITIFVGAMWAASLVFDMVNPSYQPPDTIGLAFMAVLSTLMGIIAASSKDGGKKPDEEE
ncbi:hypothetical protein L5I01_17545 [Gordonia sp. HY442]|uniref:hypothetical protein n=1 Tax=Gordonia zhenghanii TaxID=2911516 RepID=UPI001F1C63C0|nr:hypothetical protein [Gordonia zhenghanii]MCF8605161.1 hypothetical protein [Gordonia zhenghanii]